MTKYADLADLPEDERIDVIGKTIMAGPQSSADKPIMVGIVVENDTKADRYIKKLAERWPDVRLIDRVPGPVKGTVLIRMGEKLR